MQEMLVSRRRLFCKYKKLSGRKLPSCMIRCTSTAESARMGDTLGSEVDPFMQLHGELYAHA